MSRSIRKCTIVSDSIAKNVAGIRDTKICAFPGINVSRLTQKISKGWVDIDSEYVILHVGTNDINSLTVSEICASFNDLISIVGQKSSCEILVSSVLPRPIDFEVNGSKVIALNHSLEKLCKSRRITFLRSFKPFVAYGTPRREYFATRDGGLHLNFEGTRRLRQFFVNTLTQLK